MTSARGTKGERRGAQRKRERVPGRASVIPTWRGQVKEENSQLQAKLGSDAAAEAAKDEEKMQQLQTKVTEPKVHMPLLGLG